VSCTVVPPCPRWKRRMAMSLVWVLLRERTGMRRIGPHLLLLLAVEAIKDLSVVIESGCCIPSLHRPPATGHLQPTLFPPAAAHRVAGHHLLSRCLPPQISGPWCGYIVSDGRETIVRGEETGGIRRE
jgi:hypothetical protein